MKKCIALFLLLVYTTASFACSTFLLSRDGRLVFGRNYDWVSGNGVVVVNANGVQKTALVAPGEKPVSWVSECGSITFNQFGKEFPNGGMNEKGLVVELMWLSETDYPAKDERAALNELQWIQYQLDNFTTVEEVIASNKHIRISPMGAAPLHYLVADAYGHAATIEFIEGNMVVHRGKDLPQPVLTNTPYAEALRRTSRQFKGATAYNDNSVDRFATACKMVQQFQEANTKEDPVDYAFGILNKVAQGSFTKWRIVYDISNRQIQFQAGGTRKHLALKDVNFDCGGTVPYLDINYQQEGSVAGAFMPLSAEQNRQVLAQSARESRSHIHIPETSLQAAAQYFGQATCAGK